MKEKQKEGAKWAAVGALVGIVIGLLAAGHYDLKPDKDSGLAWRVDHWTGSTELLGPNSQPIMQ